MRRLKAFPHLTHHLVRLSVIVAIISTALTVGTLPPVAAQQATGSPKTVTMAGTIQSKLGCPDDWKPECDKTFLTYSDIDDVWSATFDLPAGKYEYKAALNGKWDENYGLHAKKDGPNIPLQLDNPTKVKFFYDHKTHWVTDDHNSLIVTAPGTLQSKLGCGGDWKPDCLRTWLQDPEGKGIYTFATKGLPRGNYEVKAAINLSWTENYGKDGVKDGPNIPFAVARDNAEVFIAFDPAKHLLTINTEGAPKGDLTLARAHWVSRDTIVWKVENASADTTYSLHYGAEGGLKAGPKGIEGGRTIKLTNSGTALPADIAAKFPYISGPVLKIDAADLNTVSEILKGQVAVSAVGSDGKLIDATTPQIPGVLDDLFSYNGDLGVTFRGKVPTLAVWAPTARSVTLHLFDNSKVKAANQKLPMTYDPATGVWSITGQADWTNKFYLYDVQVFVRSTQKIEDNLVTDPYSLSLSMNSTLSQIVDLNDPKLLPDGWTDFQKPPLKAPENSVIYELHIRDFSINDETVPTNLRGTYKAFMVTDSNGMKHLSALAQAGLTHIHLLPTFDIATINEDKSSWQQPDMDVLKNSPPDSDKQQAAVAAVKDKDGFNWGYDPYHYTTPEGSYSTDPDGSTRILEFRQMVQALNKAGLRVVMDVVYNHTSDSGQNEKSVLDRIVPGYYHRLNADGFVEKSSCCENTASEHYMMGKLMVDSVRTWTTAYKIDGYRFDLMGHHMVSNMQTIRQMLDSLTPEKDGVNGKPVYVYGEAWNFGEVANNARGKNAVQLNIGGLGIGSFNDRLRDATRGGGPFDSPTVQGFISGLYYTPNKAETRSTDAQKQRLLQYGDWIRVGLVGNLKDYQLVDMNGKTVTGAQVDYNGLSAGYTLDPQENIVYISAHDNDTLFDAIQFKAPTEATMTDRIRMQNLGNSIVMLSQGVPFFHAGDDMLRSKSLDRNSYNSGDWFNKLDFTLKSNNWAVGLPPAESNKDQWKIDAPLLADSELKPSPDDILYAVNYFQDILKIRKSSRLFRLETAKDIEDRVKFYNVGPEQIPGVIVMSITDNTGTQLDPTYSMIVVVFNASSQEQSIKDASFAKQKFVLHPVQADGSDLVVKTAKYAADSGTFSVPERTTAVFIILR
jgi:pullulanase